MTSDQLNTLDSRLAMKPSGSARGHVDGGWWPATDDLAAEIPVLASALGGRDVAGLPPAGTWSPLGGGWLTGKYRRDRRPTGATRLGENPDRGVEAYARRGAHERSVAVVVDRRIVAHVVDRELLREALAEEVLPVEVGDEHVGRDAEVPALVRAERRGRNHGRTAVGVAHPLRHQRTGGSEESGGR